MKNNRYNTYSSSTMETMSLRVISEHYSHTYFCIVRIISPVSNNVEFIYSINWKTRVGNMEGKTFSSAAMKIGFFETLH